jgi:tetratricopeptide (TPR) repeat protein
VKWGAALSERGQYADALKIRQRAVLAIERALGLSHLMTAVLQSRLADDYRRANRTREARAVIDSAVVVLSSPDNPSAIEYCSALRARARIQLADGQLADAHRSIKLARRVAAPLERTQPDMMIALRVLESSVLTARSDSAGARDTLKSILADYGARPGLSPAVLQRVRLSLDSLGT